MRRSVIRFTGWGRGPVTGELSLGQARLLNIDSVVKIILQKELAVIRDLDIQRSMKKPDSFSNHFKREK
jgi:hypothetical protein